MSRRVIYSTEQPLAEVECGVPMEELCFTSFFFLLLSIPFGGGDCGGETSKFNPMSLSGGSVARIRS